MDRVRGADAWYRSRRGSRENAFVRHQAFYETSAQVIPLLLVLVILQMRYIAVEPWADGVWLIWRRAITAACIAFIVVAEVLALLALFSLSDVSWRRTVIIYSLLFLLGGLLWGVVGAVWTGAGRSGDKRLAADQAPTDERPSSEKQVNEREPPVTDKPEPARSDVPGED